MAKLDGSFVAKDNNKKGAVKEKRKAPEQGTLKQANLRTKYFIIKYRLYIQFPEICAFNEPN